MTPSAPPPSAHARLIAAQFTQQAAGFGDLARATVECAGVGVCTSDYSVLDFRKVRRPIFPLDPI